MTLNQESPGSSPGGATGARASRDVSWQDAPPEARRGVRALGSQIRPQPQGHAECWLVDATRHARRSARFPGDEPITIAIRDPSEESGDIRRRRVARSNGEGSQGLLEGTAKQVTSSKRSSGALEVDSRRETTSSHRVARASGLNGLPRASSCYHHCTRMPGLLLFGC